MSLALASETSPWPWLKGAELGLEGSLLGLALQGPVLDCLVLGLSLEAKSLALKVLPLASWVQSLNVQYLALSVTLAASTASLLSETSIVGPQTWHWVTLCFDLAFR